MKVDYYPSNEDLITKLSAANGNGGFDIVMPTGPYIPQMLEKGLLRLDKSLLPNIVNVDTSTWAATGIHQRLFGLQGLEAWWFYNKAGVPRADHHLAAVHGRRKGAGSESGPRGSTRRRTWSARLVQQHRLEHRTRRSMPARSTWWRRSLPTSRPRQLPQHGPRGRSTCLDAWNGDARQAFVRIADAGGNPTIGHGRSAPPRPSCGWTTTASPPAPPTSRRRTPGSTGCSRGQHQGPAVPQLRRGGMKDIDSPMAELARRTQRRHDLLPEEQVDTMRTGAVNSAQDRHEILDKMKAAAAG